MPNTPSADFCRPVRTDCSILSLDSETNGRSPEVISTAFRTQPPNLQPVPLMDMDFAINCPLVRHGMPRIRFLYIGSHVCSTLLSDPASRQRPCASLSLHLHQVVKRTFTFKLSIMPGTQENARIGESQSGHFLLLLNHPRSKKRLEPLLRERLFLRVCRACSTA